MSEMNVDRPEPTPADLALQLERSFATLLATLALLEPAEMATARLENGWTPKAVIAHVAFWDAVQLRRMQDAVAGRSAHTGFVRPAASNDERAAEDDGRTLEAVIAAAESARRELVEFAASLTPAMLAQEYAEGEQTLSLRERLAHMANHARIHTREIGTYCGSMRRWRRDGLRALLVHQHANLMDSIAGLDEATLLSTRVCGAWSIRDVLAHVLSWNEFGYLVMKGWPQVDHTAISPWISGSEDAINANLLAVRADLDMIAIVDWLTTYHRRVLTRYDKLSDEELASIGDQGWGAQGELADLLYALALHATEHAEEIWRFRAGES
ncbi:MAG: DinB family protein, partial [Caldilineaceae bacterium]|nr:DinB family protein [Caldilineaceae bacterium]